MDVVQVRQLTKLEKDPYTVLTQCTFTEVCCLLKWQVSWLTLQN